MRKVIVNNEEIYIDDSKLEDFDTGIMEIEDSDDFEKTQELEVVDDFADTLTDLWGNNQ